MRLISISLNAHSETLLTKFQSPYCQGGAQVWVGLVVISQRLDRLIGAEVYVKHENHQSLGAFKIRGALNVVSITTKMARNGVKWRKFQGFHFVEDIRPRTHRLKSEALPSLPLHAIAFREDVRALYKKLSYAIS